MAKKKKGALVQKEEMRPVFSLEDMDRSMETFFRNPFSIFSRPMSSLPEFSALENVTPSVDIFEEGNEVVVKAEIPGTKREDIDVTITENSLQISGEKKQEEKVEKKDYQRIERRYGSFCRSFRLPDNVDSGKAKASFKDGLLEIRMPVSKEKKQKKITIS